MLLKNIYSTDFFETLTKGIGRVLPDFKKDLFLHHVFDADWENRELKPRMYHISMILKKHLAQDYKTSIEQILKIITVLKGDDMQKGIEYGELAYMFFPDFIEKNGIDYFDVSVSAFEKITQFTSCEFAVRPFIFKYPNEMLTVMNQWALHKNEHVRRLASEGCRPRLPWAMAISFLKQDPSPILPILEKLHSDPSEYVRRSVANNLNDISKDNPEIVISIAKKWIKLSENTRALVKHACRTMLKNGNQVVLQLFGYGSVDTLKVDNLQIMNNKIKIGDNLEFKFELLNNSAKAEKIRLEYGIYYRKLNGSLSRKVFKISEKEYPEKSNTTISRHQSFKQITTRKFHLGIHKLSVIINGVELAEINFELIE